MLTDVINLDTALGFVCGLYFFGLIVVFGSSVARRRVNYYTARDEARMKLALRGILRAHGRAESCSHGVGWQPLDVDLTEVPCVTMSGHFGRQDARYDRRPERTVPISANEWLEWDHVRRQRAVLRLIAGGGSFNLRA